MDRPWWTRLFYQTLFVLTCMLEKSLGSGRPNSMTAAPQWKMREYPNPQDSTSICNRPHRESWICDPNGILSKQEVLELDDMVENLRQSTDCRCDRCVSGHGEKHGYIVSLALLNKMESESYNNPSSPQNAEILNEAQMWTKYLRMQSWKMGACGNDAVLLLSVKDKVIYLSTGEELCEILSDKRTKQLLSTSLDLLADQDFFLALSNILKNYEELLKLGPEKSFNVISFGITHDEALNAGLMLFGPLCILDIVVLAFCVMIFCNIYVRGFKSHDVCYKVDYKERRLYEGFKIFCFQPLGVLMLLFIVAAINFAAVIGTLWLFRTQKTVCGVDSGAGVTWT
ncbi:uncharacterized protein [Ptychodera flava]|uniref:uncharacterized protein n=1 Tax=Ptychodera flava TaxID=63121 RepID=UPI00396A81D0